MQIITKNKGVMLFNVMGGKFKFSAQGSDLAHFFGNRTKIKIPSEIKPPLEDLRMIFLPIFLCILDIHCGHARATWHFLEKIKVRRETSWRRQKLVVWAFKSKVGCGVSSQCDRNENKKWLYSFSKGLQPEQIILMSNSSVSRYLRLPFQLIKALQLF